MSGRISDAEQVVCTDVAAAVERKLKLSATGKSYAKRFAVYLLRVNGLASIDLGPARPKFPGSLTAGNMVRDAVARELEGALRDSGRTLNLPPAAVTGRR